eukprot:1160709-Pelagomonas_calceolata.AAC.11
MHARLQSSTRLQSVSLHVSCLLSSALQTVFLHVCVPAVKHTAANCAYAAAVAEPEMADWPAPEDPEDPAAQESEDEPDPADVEKEGEEGACFKVISAVRLRAFGDMSVFLVKNMCAVRRSKKKEVEELKESEEGDGAPAEPEAGEDEEGDEEGQGKGPKIEAPIDYSRKYLSYIVATAGVHKGVQFCDRSREMYRPEPPAEEPEVCLCSVQFPEDSVTSGMRCMPTVQQGD